MKIGVVTQSNEKGQIVIPKEYREALGIDSSVSLNIVLQEDGLFVHPVTEVVRTKKMSKSDYLAILKKTQGTWAESEVDWEEQQKKQKKIERKVT